MTKKEFKEQCSFHEFGRGRNKVNAIYFDWQSNEFGVGFKYGVAMEIENGTRADLFDELYEWVTSEGAKYLSHWIYSRVATYDSQRFKAPITFNYRTWN